DQRGIVLRITAAAAQDRNARRRQRVHHRQHVEKSARMHRQQRGLRSWSVLGLQKLAFQRHAIAAPAIGLLELRLLVPLHDDGNAVELVARAHGKTSVLSDHASERTRLSRYGFNPSARMTATIGRISATAVESE